MKRNYHQQAIIYLCLASLVFSLCLSQTSASEGKRKKIRRKIIVTPGPKTTSTASTTSPITAGSTESPMENDESISFSKEDKVPRGFLDDYYAQFEDRLFDSKYPNEHPYKSLQERLVHQPSINRLEKIPEKYLKYINEARNRKKSHRISYESGQSGNFISPHSLYSSYRPNMDSNQDSKTQLKGNKNPLNSFFGLSGITSHNIQLGLTFTVPFLSFPLSAIGSILNGVGSGSNDLFNFDTQSLMIGAVMVAGALFIIPQLIYWLTGVNLSAFTWGRNDDSGDISSLINTVDHALYRYDVDTRSCMAETLCKRMRSDDGNFITGLIDKFIRSDLFKNIMGEDKVEGLKNNQCPVSSNCPWDVGPMSKFTMELLKNRGGDILSMAAREFLNNDDL